MIFKKRLKKRTLIIGKDNLLAISLLDGDGEDLLLEDALLDGGSGLLVRDASELVEVSLSDAVLLSDHLRRLTLEEEASQHAGCKGSEPEKKRTNLVHDLEGHLGANGRITRHKIRVRAHGDDAHHLDTASNGALHVT